MEKFPCFNPTLHIFGSECVDLYKKRFHSQPEYLIRAPGRVNLIGEHTDYNNGFVLPAAIDRCAWVALSILDEPKVYLYSENLGKSMEFDLRKIPRDGKGWEKYLMGVAGELSAEGWPIRGWKGVIHSDIPIGGGLSSSAAVEMAYVRSFAAAAGQTWSPKEMALIGQRADRNWVGISSGIMDQLISAAGVRDNALLLDCLSLEYRPVPMLPDCSIVVMDTKTRRQLVDSTYNKIRGECEEAALMLGGNSLRDFQDVEIHRIDMLPEYLKKRALHVISENRRTLVMEEAMQIGDALQAGSLMYDSHRSLRDDYEVSCQALDVMVECAMGHPACLGARMTGAGFGGCAIALVKQDQTAEFIARTAQCYEKKMHCKPEIFQVQISDGASCMRI